MSLGFCKICGKLYDTSRSTTRRGLCGECIIKLENLYAGVHDYLRKQDMQNFNFNIDKIAHDLKMRTSDIQLLLDMGYLDRDLQTYCNIPPPNRALARKFEREIDRMKASRRFTSYGGEIYQRNDRRE